MKSEKTYWLYLPEGVITVEMSSDDEDDYFEGEMEDMMDEWKTGGIWLVSNWPDIKAKYNGNLLDYINMKKVIGISEL